MSYNLKYKKLFLNVLHYCKKKKKTQKYEFIYVVIYYTISKSYRHPVYSLPVIIINFRNKSVEEGTCIVVSNRSTIAS